jgi:hypothetical protein
MLLFIVMVLPGLYDAPAPFGFVYHPLNTFPAGAVMSAADWTVTLLPAATVTPAGAPEPPFALYDSVSEALTQMAYRMNPDLSVII